MHTRLTVWPLFCGVSLHGLLTGSEMTDHVSPERRSQLMRGIRRKDTAPEMFVRRAAHALGLRYRLHCESLPGKPDLVLPKWRTVIFVNGCFWHRHPGCKRASVPKSNVEFWQRRFVTNVQRDEQNYARLQQMGWKVVILWECEVIGADRATKQLLRYFGDLVTSRKGHASQHRP